MKTRTICKSFAQSNQRTKTALRVATIGIAVSVAVVVVSRLIVDGFSQRIKNSTTELLWFAHIEEQNDIFSDGAMDLLDSVQLGQLNAIIAPQKAVATVTAAVVAQHWANTTGLLVIGGEGSGVAEGEIRIGESLARILGVTATGQIDITTFSDRPRLTTLKVESIYPTTIAEIENRIAFVHINTARSLSLIDPDQLSYYSVARQCDLGSLELFAQDNDVAITTVEQRAPHIFGWLSMIEQNMTLILIIMTIVALINVATATLISVVNNISTIATLRAMGMRASGVRWLFIRSMGWYVTIGALSGLAIGLTLGAIQYFTDVIELDNASYFFSAIPIAFDFWAIAIGVCCLTGMVFLSILLATSIISKLSIAQAIKYE